MSVRYKIGYIDEDLSQVKLYSRKLRNLGFDVIGYDFTKNMSLEELMKQVYDSDIDLLLIDFRLNESNIIAFNGDEVERHIYKHKPLFPHIIFTNKVDQAEPEVDDLKIIFDKENVCSILEEDESEVTSHFVNVLKKSIEQYKTLIKGKKDQISVLLEKEKEKELSPQEKNDLLSIQQDLLVFNKSIALEVPRTIMSIESLEKITKARQDAEAFVETLLNKNRDEGQK